MNIPEEESEKHWLDVWEPDSFDDVFVSKKAKSEIREWLEGTLSPNLDRAPIMLLTGPAGSGKTVLIDKVCALLDFSVFRWDIPGSLMYTTVTSSFYESQMLKFRAFLELSTRFASVVKKNMDGKRVIVVEEFPQAFYQNPEKMKEIIQDHFMTSTTPVIFACDQNTEQKLFPQSFVVEMKVKYLKLKEMSPTALYKVLCRVRNLHPDKVKVTSAYLKDLATASNGDCRSALISLYWHIFSLEKETPKPENVVASLRQEVKKRKMTKENKSIHKVRDDDLGIFHLTGQMLYPKKKVEHGSSSESCTFKHNPKEIAQSAQKYPNIALLAQENYLSTFGDIVDVSAAATYFSDVDILANKWADKDNLQEIAFNVMTYGLMTSNKHVVRKWNPWRKAKYFDVISAKESLKQKIKNELPELSIHTRSTMMEVIPIVRSCNMDSRIQQIVPDL